MPSAVSGRQWPALSPAKNTPSSVAGPDAVGDPVALVAVRLLLDVLDQPQRRLLDRVVRVEGADADAQLVARGERPAVARVDVARVDPQLEVVADARRDGPRGPGTAARPGAGSCPPARGPVASRVHRRSAARGRRRGRSVRCCPVRRLDLRGLELGLAGLLPQQVAELAVVEGREASTAAASARARPAGVCTSSESKVCRIEASRPMLRSHSVGAAQADVWRSPIS